MSQTQYLGIPETDHSDLILENMFGAEKNINVLALFVSIGYFVGYRDTKPSWVVIPAQAGIQLLAGSLDRSLRLSPAYAGMTKKAAEFHT